MPETLQASRGSQTCESLEDGPSYRRQKTPANFVLGINFVTRICWKGYFLGVEVRGDVVRVS